MLLAFQKHCLNPNRLDVKDAYYDALRKACIERDGWLHIEHEAYEKILRKYLRVGVGTKIKFLLHPIASFLDQRFGTNLVGCKSCHQRASRIDKFCARWLRSR